MPEAHEHIEHAEHAEHAAGWSKKIAMLIAVLALFLSFSETLGKSAQTDGLASNIEASDLWAFFQAKTIRQTVLRTASDTSKIELANVSDEATKAAMQKQLAAWKEIIDRYETEPSSNEGRKELTTRAQAAEHVRDTALAKYHNYELASAAYQIGIVLASASVITGMIALAWAAGGLGIIGLVFTALGLFAPHVLQLG